MNVRITAPNPAHHLTGTMGRASAAVTFGVAATAPDSGWPASCLMEILVPFPGLLADQSRHG